MMVDISDRVSSSGSNLRFAVACGNLPSGWVLANCDEDFVAAVVDLAPPVLLSVAVDVDRFSIVVASGLGEVAEADGEC